MLRRKFFANVHALAKYSNTKKFTEFYLVLLSVYPNNESNTNLNPNITCLVMQWTTQDYANLGIPGFFERHPETLLIKFCKVRDSRI